MSDVLTQASVVSAQGTGNAMCECTNLEYDGGYCGIDSGTDSGDDGGDDGGTTTTDSGGTADAASGYRKIQLTTKQSDLIVQTRDGYYADH